MNRNIFDLTGKVAFITGASSGLGVEFAKALAIQGADIALLARREDKLKTVAKEIEDFGVRALPVKCDVTDEEQIANAVEKVIDTFGRIDILINNAGFCFVKPTSEMSLEDWNRVMDVNLDGVFLTTKHVTPHMVKQNYGRIINIGSMYGLRANTTGPIAHYYASKGAIPQLTRGWAQEYALNGITVNAVAPGMFPSEIMIDENSEEFNAFIKQLVPVGRVGRLEELDGLIVFLASESCSYVTGQTIAIDGGKTAI